MINVFKEAFKLNLYSGDKIRNIALLGHSSSGKTTLTEAILFAAGVTKRQGRVNDGNTVSDFSKEEIERKVSIGTTSIPVEYKGIKYNFLDTPGYFDFIGEMYGAKRASEGTVLVVDAYAGIEVGTEKAWNNLEKYDTPTILFLNKMDREEVNFFEIMEELQDKFGSKIMPFTIPIGTGSEYEGFIDVVSERAYVYGEGVDADERELTDEERELTKDLRVELIEKVAETDEEFMEKYFSGEKFTYEEIIQGFKNSIKNDDLVPLIVGSAEKCMGIDFLLHMIENYLPSPEIMPNPIGEWDGEEMVRDKGVDEPFSAVVFKTIVDPYIGKLSLFRVLSGKLTEQTKIYNSTKGEDEKLGGLFFLRGKEQISASEIRSGDIGATSRLNHTETGDTLCDRDNKILYETIEYPAPTLWTAIELKNRGDEDKLYPSLRRLQEEDPTFDVVRNSETRQLLIGGQGNMQLRVIIEKLKNSFDIDVIQVEPKVAYRETISATASVQGRHKKQSGGAGQYGDVHIRLEPYDEDIFLFEEEVFGGSVPRNYFPAVEDGIIEAMKKGVIAGYPVVNVKVVLFDGSHHPVDSNEMAFKIAGSMAFKKGMEQAKPILLEPIMSLEIEVPEEYMGDIMGDMNQRRGRILGMEQDEDGNQIVNAEAPQSEVFSYAIDLRAMTQAKGKFKMEFLRYERVPNEVLEKVVGEKRELVNS